MKRGLYFHFDVLGTLFSSIDRGETKGSLSLDLNLSETKWEITGDRLKVGNEIVIDIKRLESIRSIQNKIFIFKGNELSPVEIRSDGYYKLVPTSSAPTLEINGIKMHRSKGIDPLTDAKLKTELLVKNNDRVLDTCGGLGYSAVFALKAGARSVISTEKSRDVITLRNMNPWLDTLKDERLSLRQGDITREIHTFKAGFFNSILHDPPRFSSATGDLYGKAFYGALGNVMAKGSRLFHYTGSPKKIKHQDRFVANTMKRLEQCGFTAIRFHENLQGIYAEKP